MVQRAEVLSVVKQQNIFGGARLEKSLKNTQKNYLQGILGRLIFCDKRSSKDLTEKFPSLVHVFPRSLKYWTNTIRRCNVKNFFDDFFLKITEGYYPMDHRIGLDALNDCGKKKSKKTKQKFLKK